MLSSPLVISLFVFGFVGMLVLGLLAVWRNSAATDVEDRLATLVGGKKAAPKLKTSELLAEASNGMGGLAGRVGGTLTKLGTLLEQADNPLTPHTFFVATGVCAGLGFAAAVLGRGAGAPVSGRRIGSRRSARWATSCSSAVSGTSGSPPRCRTPWN